MKWIFGVLLVAACGFAQAADTKAQPGTCDSFTNALEASMKDLAFVDASGIGDNSAARESNRLLEKVIATNMMQMNLTLMQLNKCPAPRQPVFSSDYGLDAMRCSTAVMKARLAGDKNTQPECDRSKWSK